ncbi:general odorant-binding protein 69a-like [Odontomachus brunneus]|uniref:general odorant-binding protein 69a-like n=1 Tax=Odontomachus brunneus TaxID=486640 RepID=UPI0013F1FB80|nr:general odorant-binding protein 69a-like [Odontomachus brunneus]
MKNVILFVSFVLATSLFWNVDSKRMSFEEIKETLQPVRKICIDRVGTDPKMIDEANKGNFVPDRKLQCYFKCMMVMTRVMTKDDKLVEKMFINIAELMVEEKYTEPFMQTIINCKEIALQPLEGCELAYEILKCFYEYNPSLTFLP